MFGVPWGRFPLTIHSAGWGITFNLAVAIIVSFLFPESEKDLEGRTKKHALLKELASVPEDKQKFKPLALILTLFWFIVGFGPFAVVGNTLFSNPDLPETWKPFGLPSLWVWQLVMLVFGIFVMWFLAFFLGLSKPISPEKVTETYEKHYGNGQEEEQEAES